MVRAGSETYKINTNAGTIKKTDVQAPEVEKYGTQTEEYKQQNMPAKKGFFTNVKEKFSEYKKQKSEENMAKAVMKKQYSEQIAQTNRESRLRDYEAKLQEQQAYASMSPEEKSIVRKQKFEAYGNKLQSVLGGSSGMSFEEKVGRMSGTGFNQATQRTTPSGPFGNVERMLGRTEHGGHVKIQQLATSNGGINFGNKVKSLTTGTKYQTNIKSELGSMNIKKFLPGKLGLNKNILGGDAFSSKKMKALLGKK